MVTQTSTMPAPSGTIAAISVVDTRMGFSQAMGPKSTTLSGVKPLQPAGPNGLPVGAAEGLTADTGGSYD